MEKLEQLMDEGYFTADSLWEAMEGFDYIGIYPMIVNVGAIWLAEGLFDPGQFNDETGQGFVVETSVVEDFLNEFA